MGTTMMIKARANSVCGECRSAQRAIVSNFSASQFMHRPLSGPQPITFAPGGAQVAWEARIGLDLAAEPGNLHVDRAFVDAAADALAQRLATQHIAEPRRQGAQQRDLGIGERHALTLLHELAQREVELEGPEFRVLGAYSGIGRPPAAQHALDAQQKLTPLQCLTPILAPPL